MPRAKELGLVRITRWVNNGSQLIQLDRASCINTQGEHQLIATRGTPFDNRTIQAKHYRLIGLGIHQPRIGILHGQLIGQALQAISPRLHVENTTEISSGVYMEGRLIDLQCRTPGDIGADIVVVVIRGECFVLPVLITRVAGVLQMRSARIQAGITEQHIGTVCPHKRHTTQLSLPLTGDKLEGHYRAVSQACISSAIRDDKEAGIGWIQATEISHIANRLIMYVGPNHFTV